MVVNDYALVGGWVNHVAENVVPNTCWVDGDVFYARLNSGCGEIKCDESTSAGFYYPVYYETIDNPNPVEFIKWVITLKI